MQLTNNEIQMELMHHAPMSPSTLGKLVQCSQFISGPSTADAARGTMLHKVMETGEGYVELNDYDREQIDIATQRVDELCQLYLSSETEKLIDLREQKLDTGIDDVWGTVDRVLMHRESKRMLVIDYKFGVNQVEPVRSNFQSICYSLALFRKYPKIIEISFCFIHPAINMPNGINAGCFDRSDFSMMKDIIAREVRNIETYKGLSPEPDVCKFCDRLLSCSAVKAKVEQHVLNFNDSMEVTDEVVDSAKIAEAKIKTIIAKARKDAIEGKVFESYKLIEFKRRNSLATLADVKKMPFAIDEQTIDNIPIKLKALNEIVDVDSISLEDYLNENNLLEYKPQQQFRRIGKRKRINSDV